MSGFVYPAEKAFGLLHAHARNGYEPGDCHCDACALIVDDLCDELGIAPETHADPQTGIWSPAAALRSYARNAGWL